MRRRLTTALDPGRNRAARRFSAPSTRPRRAEDAVRSADDPLEALASSDADEAFAIRIRRRRSWRCAQDLKPHRLECVVHRGCGDGIAIVDDESTGRVERQIVPELLDAPSGRQVPGHVPMKDSKRSRMTKTYPPPHVRHPADSNDHRHARRRAHRIRVRREQPAGRTPEVRTSCASFSRV